MCTIGSQCLKDVIRASGKYESGLVHALLPASTLVGSWSEKYGSGLFHALMESNQHLNEKLGREVEKRPGSCPSILPASDTVRSWREK